MWLNHGQGKLHVNLNCCCLTLSRDREPLELWIIDNVDGLSIISTGKERWTAISRSGAELETQFNGVTEKLGVSAPSMEVVYFNAPGEREKWRYSSSAGGQTLRQLKHTSMEAVLTYHTRWEREVEVYLQCWWSVTQLKLTSMEAVLTYCTGWEREVEVFLLYGCIRISGACLYGADLGGFVKQEHKKN